MTFTDHLTTAKISVKAKKKDGTPNLKTFFNLCSASGFFDLLTDAEHTNPNNFMATKKRKTAKEVQNELYLEVAKNIIELLETHQKLNYVKPWISLATDGLPCRNITTDKPYTGINKVLLSFFGDMKNYPKNAWLTFKQAKEQGGNVKRGEKSSPIYFFKPLIVDKNRKYYTSDEVKTMSEAEINAKDIQFIPMLKRYRVFNVFQTEGLPEEWYKYEEREPLPQVEQHQRAEQVLNDSGAKIEIKSCNRAFYTPTSDSITLPLREQFTAGMDEFYSTALHELCHWTGHPSRLNRKQTGRFGSKSYAREELYAELGAAFICAELGYEKTITNSAAYLKGWLKALEENPRYIFSAFKQAQKAADYIMERTSVVA